MPATVNQVIASGARSMQFSADQTRLFVSMGNGSVVVIDVATRATVATWSISSALGALSVSDDGSFLLVADAAVAGRLHRVDTATGLATAINVGGGVIRDVEIIDANSALFTAGGFGTPPSLLNLQTNTLSSITGGVNYSDSSMIRQDGRLVLLAEQGISNAPLYLYDVTRGQVTASTTSRNGFNWGHEAVSERAGLVAGFLYYNTVEVYSNNFGSRITLNVGTPADGLSFDPLGEYLYVRTESGRLMRYDTTNWTVVEVANPAPASWTNSQTYNDQILVDRTNTIQAVRTTVNGQVHLIDDSGGNDVLVGTAGGDALAGGVGADHYTVNHIDDVVTEAANEGLDTVVASIDYTLAEQVERLELIGGAVNGTGNARPNDIIGNALDNSLSGMDGNDLLIGNAGIDTLLGGNGNDILEGGDGNDILRGNTGADRLLGGADDDLLDGGDDNDILAGDAGNDVLAGGAGNDWLGGGAGNDDLDGGEGDDTVDGQDGDDTISGGLGTDTLRGGAGNDIVRAGRNNSADGGTGDDELTISLFNLTMGSTIDFRQYWSGGNGLNGTGIITGFERVVSIIGSNGNDTIRVGTTGTANGGATPIARGYGGDDLLLGGEGVDQLTGDDGIDTLLGFGGDDQLQGGTGNDRIEGGEGNDSLRGDEGVDVLIGGNGSDTYIYGDGVMPDEDQIVENANATGVDRLLVRANVANVVDANFTNVRNVEIAELSTLNDVPGFEFTLGAQFQAAGFQRVIGSADIDASQTNIGQLYVITLPNIRNLTMVGGSGNDIFSFDIGALSSPVPVFDINGGGGTNTLSFAELLQPVTFDLGTGQLSGPNFPSGTYANFQNATGSSQSDTILGSSGNNVIDGGDGNDVLTSGGGDDTIFGGGGDDAISLGATLTSADTINGGGGTDQVGISGDYGDGNALVLTATMLTNVELLAALPGAGNSYSITTHDATVAAGATFTVFGSNLGAGQNFAVNASAETDGTIITFGGLGTDTITGGTLNDGFYFGPNKWQAGDSVVGGLGGNDQLALDGNYTTTIGATADVEVLVLLAGPDRTPNSFNITLDDVWTAAGQTKTVFGRNNTLGVTINGSAETSGNFIFFGGFGHDTLTGGTGSDQIYGLEGNDTITGGLGSDTAVYQGLRASYSVVTGGGSVQIVDNDAVTDGNDGTDGIVGIEFARFADQTISITSPIILDLDGGGVTTLSAANSNAAYDMDGDGIGDDTSWFGRGEGLLFLDRDGNGTLSNAGEMSFTNDVANARSDLEGLAAFDSNGDGQLSKADSRFREFKIWRDRDGDGVVGRGEVMSLNRAGVRSLSLTGTANNASYALGDTAVVNHGSFTRTNGRQGGLIDAVLTAVSSKGAAEQAGIATLAQDDPLTALRDSLAAGSGTISDSHDPRITLMAQDMASFGARSSVTTSDQWRRQGIGLPELFAA